jgi:hypothetical protein
MAVPKITSFYATVIPDAFIIAIISFASSISVVDFYAKKYRYKTDSNKVIYIWYVGVSVGLKF